MPLLAVYGTLKKGHCNQGFMRTSTFMGAGQTQDSYWMPHNGAGAPVVTRDINLKPVRVEVYEVPLEVLEGPLDAIESNGRVYTREIIPINMDDGSKLDCYLYLHNSPSVIWGYRDGEAMIDDQPYDWS